MASGLVWDLRCAHSAWRECLQWASLKQRQSELPRLRQVTCLSAKPPRSLCEVLIYCRRARQQKETLVKWPEWKSYSCSTLPMLNFKITVTAPALRAANASVAGNSCRESPTVQVFWGMKRWSKRRSVFLEFDFPGCKCEFSGHADPLPVRNSFEERHHGSWREKSFEATERSESYSGAQPFWLQKD